MDTMRATAAGAVATGVTTALWLVEPSIGLPKIAIGHMLSTLMSVSVAHSNVGAAGGWIVHLIVGIVLAFIYASFVAARAPGHTVIKGATYGFIIFIVAQLAFMPLVGAGVFSGGDVQMILGSLLGHVLFGVVVAWIYGSATPAAVPQAA